MSKQHLVFFDIDGTLLPYGQNVINDDVINAIDEIKNDNTEVFICTGRCRNQAQAYIDQLKTTSFICSNGQDVVYKGEQLYKNSFTDSNKTRLMEIFDNHEVHWGYETQERIYLPTKEAADALVEGLKEYGILDVQVSMDNLKKEIFQFWVFGHKQLVDTVEAEISKHGFHSLKWNDNSLEILPGDENKAKGIEFLKTNLEANGAQVTTYAFGDGVNDIEMLKYVDKSVAMGNAKDTVKLAANYISTDCREDGIKKGLETVGLR